MTSDEKRRYERVIIIDPDSDVVPLERAFVLIGDSKFAVYDLSLKGLSFERSEKQNLEQGKSEKLKLQINKDIVDIDVNVVRVSDQFIACEILAMTVENRELFNSFLENKLVGRHLAYIEEEHYREERDFDSWFAGPRDFHVYLSFDSETGQDLEKIKIDTNEYTLKWSPDQSFDLEMKTQMQSSLPETKAEILEILTHAGDYEGKLKKVMAILQS